MISAEDKATFLALLKIGKTPAEAAVAVNPEYTASMFRRLTNENNPNYDNAFAADYLRARAEGRTHAQTPTTTGQPRTTTLSGHLKAKYITDEMLDHFIEQISEGVPMKKAADSLEPKTSLGQLNKRALQDKTFADRYAEAKTQGYPVFQEKVRGYIVAMAEEGDYRAAKDLALIHLPEFKQLMTTRHEISGPGGEALRVLAQQALPDLPDAVLEKLVKELEKAKPPDAEAA